MILASMPMSCSLRPKFAARDRAPIRPARWRRACRYGLCTRLARFLRTPWSLGASVFPHLDTVFFVFLSATIGVTFSSVFSFPICTRVRVRAPFCLRWCCSLKNWFRRFEVSLTLAEAVGRLPPPGGARGAAKQEKGHGKERGGGPAKWGPAAVESGASCTKGAGETSRPGDPSAAQIGRTRPAPAEHPACPR